MRRNIKECQRRTAEQSRSELHVRGSSMMPHILLPILMLTLIVCGIESSKFGVVPPNLYTRLNNTFEVSCYVHGIDGVLNFYDGDSLVDESLIKRTNGTFITYRNSCQKPIKKNLTCKRGEHIVGTSEIFIDGDLQPVSGFRCATRNLKHLTCGFKQSSNIIPNSYNLFYSINGNAKSKQIDLEPDFKGGYNSKAIKIIKYDGLSQLNYNFSLVAKRMKVLEEDLIIENFHYELLEALMPPPIAHIAVINQNNTDNNAVIVVLTLPNDVEKISNHLMFHIRLKAKDENDSAWMENILSDLKRDGDKVFVPLMDLKYANTEYQFKVRIKSKTSDEKLEKVWSEFREKSFKTYPKQPERLPRVCRNCFSIMDNGNVFVYWMEVPKFYQNGDNFGYELRIKNERDMEVKRIILKKASYMIPSTTNVSKVEIFSVNALGRSEHHKALHIMTKNNRNHLRIKKELYNDFGYKLSWKIHDDIVKDIESYTVIWCKQRNELPNQCDGSIAFETIPHDRTEFSLNTSQSSESFQFGIAVNRLGNTATGFQWAKCTASRPNEIGKIPSVWVDGRMNDTSIEIAWDLNCADEDIVKGYNISYCAMAMNLNQKNCDQPKYHVVLLSKVNIKKHRLTSLKPYTKYNISIAMISTSDIMGPFSKPILVQTMEGTPTAPRNLTAIDIRATSVDLMWRRPSEINGPSLTYQLWCNEKSFHIDNNETMNENFYYTLDNLESFTSYSIRVIAETRNSSDPSERLVIRTDVGLPGRVGEPTVLDMRNGTLKLDWNPPAHLGGHLDFYQLNISIHRGMNVLKNYSVYRISGKRTSCLAEFGESGYHEIFFYIRAVNINSNMVTHEKIGESINCLGFREKSSIDENYFYGEWSPPNVHISNHSSLLKALSSSSTALIITFCFALSLLSFFSYCILRFYKIIQRMKDIKAIYPEGLNPNEPPLINIRDATLESIKDVDLLRSHVLTDIEEEDVTQEVIEEGWDHKIEPLMRESQSNDDGVCNSFLIINNKPISLPPLPLNGPLLRQSNSIDNSYVKMHKPRVDSNNDNLNSPVGYLDMSGKSPTHSSSAYTSIEIKNLLENSRQNDGYIDRKSIHKNPLPMNTNSNGYIAFRKS